jgi:hypothetical protein
MKVDDIELSINLIDQIKNLNYEKHEEHIFYPNRSTSKSFADNGKYILLLFF